MICQTCTTNPTTDAYEDGTPVCTECYEGDE